MCWENSRRVCLLPTLAIILAEFIGCGGKNELPNRVAIEVAIQIGGEAVGDGSLVLRPLPGVKCPLIMMPVTDGVGNLPQSAGPVPGTYRATFRPKHVQANITRHLSETGRVRPRAAGAVSSAATTSAETKILMPKSDMELTVPDRNPAFVAISFDPA